ncbi:hypothetical protein N7535_009180 [Penicillium sp. DV-2018c]|nr:hypothetical protein N7461_002919 [Penicillium sp. DV-2018c]KAJ5560983.1 hypothetical protein N7535_009180 [Penicillium sp. DV-2018c]
MKTTSTIALVLATATSALAAPTPTLKPLELTGLNAGVYSTSLPQTALFSFKVKDPNNNVETACSSYWSIGMAGNKTYDCVDKDYKLHLPNGIYDVEKFDFGVSRADGSASGRATLNGGSWECKDLYVSPLEQCKWDGTFYLNVVPSSA